MHLCSQMKFLFCFCLACNIVQNKIIPTICVACISIWFGNELIMYWWSNGILFLCFDESFDCILQVRTVFAVTADWCEMWTLALLVLCFCNDLLGHQNKWRSLQQWLGKTQYHTKLVLSSLQSGFTRSAHCFYPVYKPVLPVYNWFYPV